MSNLWVKTGMDLDESSREEKKGWQREEEPNMRSFSR